MKPHINSEINISNNLSEQIIKELNENIKEYNFSFEKVGQNYIGQNLYTIKNPDNIFTKNILNNSDTFYILIKENNNKIESYDFIFLTYYIPKQIEYINIENYISENIAIYLLKNENKMSEFLNKNNKDILSKKIYENIKDKIFIYNKLENLENLKLEEINKKIKKYGLILEKKEKDIHLNTILSVKYNDGNNIKNILGKNLEILINKEYEEKDLSFSLFYLKKNKLIKYTSEEIFNVILKESHLFKEKSENSMKI